MDDAPLVLPGHRIDVTAAEKTFIVGVLEIFDSGRKFLQRNEIKLDAALVLLAAFDQQFFLVTLAFEGDAGQLAVEHYGDCSGHQEHKQQRETTLARQVLAGSCISHAGSSSTS